MKKILATAAIVMSLMACGNSGNNSEINADTPATRAGDTMNSMPIDTSSLNTGDSTGINRDTSRADRTRLNKKVDTTIKKRSGY